MRGSRIVAVVTVALVAAAAAPAAIHVAAVDTSAYPQIRLTVVTSAPTQARPRVAETGGGVTGVRTENLGAAPSIVVALDRSASMAGAALTSAVDAARFFVARKRAGDRVAVVAFGSDVIRLTSFSAAATDHVQALEDLTWDRRPGTALYDALRASAEALEEERGGGRVVILLTDGRNRAGGASLDDAVAAARRAGAVVYTIAIDGSDLSLEPLRAIARATGGHTVAVSSGTALADAYAAIRSELRRTWRLEYITGARPGEPLRLRVWVPGMGSSRAEAAIPGSSARARPGEPTVFGSAPADFALAALVAALVFAATRALSGWRRARWLRRRLERPAAEAAEGGPRRSMRDRLRGSFAGVLANTEAVGERLGPWRALERLLERARVPLRAAELLYAMLGTGFAVALFLALFGPPSLVILLGLVVGSTVPLLVVWRRATQRRRAFEEQLPDLLMTLASALKAGQSFRQGIQTIVDEGAEPAVSEFRLVLSEARLGRPLEQALAEMADRLDSKDFSFVVSAVTIQRQVGGSLAGIFDMVADAVRQRQQFGRRIKALTATGRMSAYVLAALPIGLAVAMTAISPTFMAPLYGTPLGRTMIGSGLVMIAIGSLILRKIVSFKG